MKRDLKGWGPFGLYLTPEEQRARIRCVRALVVVFLGRRGLEINTMLRLAESDLTLLDGCRLALVAVPELQLRQIWNAYTAVEIGSAPGLA